MSITVAMYSHDSVGLGHARRNRALAYSLAADLPRFTGEEVRGLLIAGHPGATADELPTGWDWLVLPGFTPAPGGYTSRRLNVSTEQLWHVRSSTAAAALEAVRPDLFIADRHAFGVDHELLPALETLRGLGTRCVLGMREVLDTPDVAAKEWQHIGGAAAVLRYYDAMWIYGDQSIYDPVATGEIPDDLGNSAQFTGYLSHGRPDDPLSATDVHAQQPYILTIVGGGSDGGAVAQAAAAAEIPAGHQHIILTGPHMPQADYAAIADALQDSPTPEQQVHIIRYAPHVPSLIRDAAAVISMGGYNSAAEIMATTTPALIVPRTSRRAEQPRRAEALAAAGLVETLPAAKLSAQALSHWLATAVIRRCTRDAVNLDGLMRVGHIAAAEVAAGREYLPITDSTPHALPHGATASDSPPGSAESELTGSAAPTSGPPTTDATASDSPAPSISQLHPVTTFAP